MKTLLIDDEILNLRTLRSQLEENFPWVEIVGEAASGAAGIEMIYRSNPDLLLLDIEMPDMTGFEMLEKLHSYPFGVIFVTAYSQYGIQAVKMSALDYLLKPVQLDELGRALHKAKERISHQQSSKQIVQVLDMVKNPKKPRLAIALPNETRLLELQDVIRMEAHNNYTHLFLVNEEKALVVSKGMYEYEELLREYWFVRCHQSHIINMNYLERVVYEKNGGQVFLTNGKELPLSRTKKDFIRDCLLQRASGVIS